MLRTLTAFALLYVLWLPLQPKFTWLMATLAEPILRLVEHPPLITSLATNGNSVQFYSFLTGAAEPMASWSTETIGGFLLAPIALILVLAAPAVRRSTLFRLLGLTLMLVFLIMVGIAVTQIKLAAGTHASTVLGIAVHTPAETAWLARINDVLYVVGMMGLPVFLFLATYAYLRWLPAGRAAAPASNRRAQRWKTISGTALALVGGIWILLPLARSAPETDPASYHESWSKILRLNPQFAPAQVNVGLHLAGSGRLDEAIELYRSAVRNDPGLVEAHFNLGTAWLEKRRDDRAAESLLEAVRLSPAHAEAHRNLALAYGRLDRSCEALLHLRKSTDLSSRFAREPAVQRAVETLESRCAAR